MSGPPTAATPPRGHRKAARIWLWVSVALGALTVGLVAFSLTNPKAIDSFGNSASVWGLWVSVVGFGLTVGAVLQTLWATQEAQRQIAAAVAEGQRERREAVEKIALQLLQGECERVYRHAADALRAAESRRWERMEDRLRDAQRDAIHLCQFRPLLDEEKVRFRAAVEEIGDVADFVRDRMIPVGDAAPSPHKAKTLQDARNILQQLLTSLERLLARLQHLVLEAPHVDG